MKKDGFSVIECMVYSFLFILLSTMLFSWMTIVQNQTMQHTSKDALMSLECGLDVFARDIRMAPSEPVEWKKVTAHELIWHTKDSDIGWCLINKTLFRIEGTYHSANNTWIKKVKSLIATRIEDLSFDISRDSERVTGVKYTYHKKRHFIAVRNRRMV